MRIIFLIAVAVSWLACVPAAVANFHLMQIEQIISGVNGDITAQAIQLRVRSNPPAQNQIQNARIRLFDNTGGNPITLLTIGSSVTNGAVGDNILLASTKFDTLMAGQLSTVGGTAYSPDLVLASLIPAGYFLGGRITFEETSTSTIYWSVAYGNYSGSTAANAANGSFGSPTTITLPSSGVQALKFNGAASATSTANSTDYSLVTSGVTVRNNAGKSFTVVPEPGAATLLVMGALGLGGLLFARRRA